MARPAVHSEPRAIWLQRGDSSSAQEAINPSVQGGALLDPPVRAAGRGSAQLLLFAIQSTPAVPYCRLSVVRHEPVSCIVHDPAL